MIENVALGLGAVLMITIAGLLSRRVGVPSAVLLVLAGVVYALAPGPNVHLDPELILFLVLPPLLYSAALNASLIEIRAALRPVVSLSVLLVIATALGVGVAVSLAVPGIPLAAGVALGAACAPPDPVASLAIGRRAKLPPRLITLIEGEGLLNDASALTTYQVAVVAAVSGAFSFWSAAGRFGLDVIGGIVAGVLVASLVGLPRRWIDEPVLENALSLATPFAAYVISEEVHASGVLAVVVAGLLVGHRAPRTVSAASRLQIRAAWRLIDFLLEGFVFLLIGDQLPSVLRGLRTYSAGTVTAATVATVGVVLLLRPLWLFVSSQFPGRLLGQPGGRLSRSEILAMTFAGTRGVISLATIFALPLSLNSGEPFPYRDLLIFCTYIVVLVTLVGQGLAFGPLLRRIGLQEDPRAARQERAEARLAAAEAGLRFLEDLPPGRAADRGGPRHPAPGRPGPASARHRAPAPGRERRSGGERPDRRLRPPSAGNDRRPARRAPALAGRRPAARSQPARPGA